MSEQTTIPSWTLVVGLVISIAVASYFKYANNETERQGPQVEVVQPLDRPGSAADTGNEQIEANIAEQSVAASVNETEVDEQQIIALLSEQLPQFNFTSATKSSISGLFEVVAEGQILYVNETADYVIDGSLIRLSDRANLTDATLGRLHLGLIDELDESDMLIYEPDEPSDRSITVFTDISCGYCRLLHGEMDKLLDAGLRVRYLLFPRAGLGTQAHQDLESVWCADNPQEAMTNAKAGGVIEEKSCSNPIETHIALAERVGLRGTPLIYTDSGEKLAGYREAAVLSDYVLGTEPLVSD